MDFSIILSVLYLIILLIFAFNQRFFKKVKSRNLFSWKFIITAIVIFIVAFLLRLWLGYTSTSFENDLNLFKNWAKITNEVGFKNVYNENMFLDYPPGYLYVLTGMEKLRLALGLDYDSGAYNLLLKLPSIIGDMLCGYILLHYSRKKLDSLNALFISAAYLFCPAIIINSAQWGQIDSFCTTILLISILLLYNEKYLPSAILFAVSIACKPQMLVFTPIYLFITIRRKHIKELAVSILVVVASILLIAKPYTTGFNYLWLIDQYKSTMSNYSYYTVNAYNIWGLFGLNWIKLPKDGNLSWILTLIGPVIAVIISAIAVIKAKRNDVIFACAYLLMFCVYIFSIKMHERYLFMGLIFILMSYIFTSDRRLLYAFGLTSTVHYFNVSHVLYLYDDMGGAYEPNALIVKILSFLQIAAFAYLLYVSYQIYVKNRFSSRNSAALKGQHYARNSKVTKRI